MKQYDIVINKNKTTQKNVPYLLVLQSDSISILPLRIVAPIRNAGIYEYKTINKLHLPLQIKGVDYIAFISEMAAIPINLAGDTIARVREMRTEISSAIDLIFTGF